MPDEPRVEPTAVLLTRIRTGLAFVFSIVVVLFLIFDAALLIWLLIQIFGTTSVLENKFGINKWLSMAVALILTGPLFWGAKREFQALSEKKESRTLAQVAFGLYTCVYFVAMFILQRDVAFDPKTGKAVQCYSFDLEGNIRLGSCGGYDTRTGQVLQPVTPEILDAFEQQQSGNKPRPVPVEIFLREGGFDRNTGLSRVWFARRANGGFELFDRRGYDGVSSSQLQPMTPEVAHEVRRWSEATTMAEQQRASKEQRAAAARLQDEQRRREEAEGIAFLDRIIDRNSRRVAGAANIAVRLIESPGTDSASVSSAVNRALRDRGFNVIALFKPAFAQEGFDQALFEGNSSLAKRLQLAEHCDSLLLGVVRIVSPPRSAGGMYITEMALDIRKISPVTGSVVDQLEVREKGGALDARSSVAAAVDKLASSTESQLVAWPTT